MAYKPIKTNNNYYSNLYLYRVLLRYDYPINFICFNDYGEKFLLYTISSSENENEEWDKWLIYNLDEKQYERLINGKLSIRELMVKNHKHTALKYDYIRESASFNLINSVTEFLPVEQHNDYSHTKVYNEDILNRIVTSNTEKKSAIRYVCSKKTRGENEKWKSTTPIRYHSTISSLRALLATNDVISVAKDKEIYVPKKIQNSIKEFDPSTRVVLDTNKPVMAQITKPTIVTESSRITKAESEHKTQRYRTVNIKFKVKN